MSSGLNDSGIRWGTAVMSAGSISDNVKTSERASVDGASYQRSLAQTTLDNANEDYVCGDVARHAGRRLRESISDDWIESGSRSRCTRSLTTDTMICGSSSGIQ